MHLQAGLLLLGVTNQIGHYGHIVGYILAYRDRDRFAAIVLLQRTVERAGCGTAGCHIEADANANADAAAAAIIWACIQGSLIAVTLRCLVRCRLRH